MPLTRGRHDGDNSSLLSLEAPREYTRAAASPRPKFRVGQKVQGKFQAATVGASRAKWYPATIAAAQHADDDDSYDLHYDDGDEETDVPSRFIRPAVDSLAAELVREWVMAIHCLRRQHHLSRLLQRRAHASPKRKSCLRSDHRRVL